MFRQTGRLLRWGISANPLHTCFLILTVAGSLLALTITDAAMLDLSNRANDLWRAFPYDLRVTGAAVAERAADVRSLPGVRHAELTYRLTVSIGTTTDVAVVPTEEGVNLPTEYRQGRAPASADEIAVPETTAMLQDLQLGDQVEVFVPTGVGAIVKCTVCGITFHRHGAYSCLTEAGMARLDSDYVRGTTLLITADGTVPTAELRDAIAQLGKGLTFEIPELEAMNNSVLGMALLLAKTVSWLMVIASIGGFSMLLALGERARSYDFGVLRAVGCSSNRLVWQLALEGGCLITLGGALTVGLLLLLGSRYDFGNLQSLLARNLSLILLLLALWMGAVLRNGLSIAGRPVTSLLRD